MPACPHCGGAIKPNVEKLKVVLGGAGAVLFMGWLLATPCGWLAVLPAALSGSDKARQLLALKAKLCQSSNEAGGYFECCDCGKQLWPNDFFN